MWMPVSISTFLLALISMMTAGIHEVDSFCVLGTLKKVLFPQRQHKEAHWVCWDPVWSSKWLCLWHFSFKLASAVFSGSFTSGEILFPLGKGECSPLNLEWFFGPFEGDHLLKQMMYISHRLKIISLKLILLDALQIVWHSWIWKKWEIQDSHSPKSGASTAAYELHEAAVFLLGLCCVHLLEICRQFLTCLDWVFPAAELSFGYLAEFQTL